MAVETESIDKTCICGEEATGVVKFGKRSLELCKQCSRDLLWALIHDGYSFEDEDDD